ncbi:MAG TPA: hypothetical protein VNN99_09850 [Vicinamibacterales bacterium]|nr:hypothetical protein [Vicinamibacterales bacterium]
MAEVWGKLNLKDQTAVLVVNAPPSFESQLKALDGVTVKRRPADVKSVDFSLAFVTRQKEVDDLARVVAKKAKGDAGFEPVRMVAIDDDWTAMRARRVEFIKNLTRPESFALSTEGKKRTARR